MAPYPETATLREARALYFARNELPEDGGYDAKWVSLKLGPIPVGFPNVPSRVRAVRFHDLHHVLTGYESDWTGEAEISAWEIASSCAGHWAAWLLNLYGILIGWLIAPGRTYRAFVRGRHSHNLYRESSPDPLLDKTVGETRAALGLHDAVPAANGSDRLAWLGWSTAAFGLALTGAAVWLVPAVWLTSRLSG